MFLVVTKLRFPSREEAEALVPQEKIVFGRLVAEGKIIEGYLAEDRATEWLIVAAPSEREARKTLDELPMSHWFEYENFIRIVRLTEQESD